MNFVPKEKSKEAIENLLAKRNERSREREAERRERILRGKYGE